jgi:hypothetical protein
MRGMFAWPHVEKFMPLWACFALTLAMAAGFLALLIVLASTARRQQRD